MLAGCDLAALALPLVLLAVELHDRSRRRGAKLIYLLSVTGLYATLLLGLESGNKPLVVSATMASAVFHAVEYLAVVTHYAWRRREQGSAGAFQRVARQWTLTLGGFVVLWGLCAFLIDRGTPEQREVWLGLNLWAASLHYAFDGLIWKLRKPQTAQVLGVEIPPAGCGVKLT